MASALPHTSVHGCYSMPSPCPFPATPANRAVKRCAAPCRHTLQPQCQWAGCSQVVTTIPHAAIAALSVYLLTLDVNVTKVVFAAAGFCATASRLALDTMASTWSNFGVQRARAERVTTAEAVAEAPPLLLAPSPVTAWPTFPVAPIAKPTPPTRGGSQWQCQSAARGNTGQQPVAMPVRQPTVNVLPAGGKEDTRPPRLGWRRALPQLRHRPWRHPDSPMAVTACSRPRGGRVDDGSRSCRHRWRPWPRVRPAVTEEQVSGRPASG